MAPKSRQQINAAHYQKRKAPPAHRTRALAGKTTLTKSAASMRRRRALSRQDLRATLKKDGWQVYRKKWADNQVKGVCKQLRGVCKGASAAEFKLRADCEKRLAIPINKFEPTVLAKVITQTESLSLPGCIVCDAITCILARNGARRQSAHVDTRATAAYSVLHVMSQRYIHIGKKLIKLGAGDVLVMQGGTCHAGAAHTLVKPSMLIHVPIGFTETTTRPCQE